MTERATETVLAVDPGRVKCGVAVVSGPSSPQCFEKAVVETERLTLEVAERLRQFPAVARLIVGGGTNSATLRRALQSAFPHLPLLIIDEYNTTMRARQRYLQENLPQGWRRLLPLGLRSPERPCDDYAALLLAEDYFAAETS